MMLRLIQDGTELDYGDHISKCSTEMISELYRDSGPTEPLPESGKQSLNPEAQIAVTNGSEVLSL